jgi:hypothetical protein
VVWKQLDKTWHDTTVEYCDVCGNLLIKRYWSFEDESGRETRCCSEVCEDLYSRLRSLDATAGTPPK